MTSLFIQSVKIKIKMGDRFCGEKILHSVFLRPDNLKSIFSQVMLNKKGATSLQLATLELNLGVIPEVQFDIQFNQRLSQVFAQCLVSEEASVGGAQRINLQTPHPGLQEWINEYHPDEKALFQQARDCVQPGTRNTLLKDSPASLLQRLLRQLLEGAWKYPKVMPACWYNRVTAGRLSTGALLYLLNSQEGQDWLSQHTPAVSLMTDWAAAVQGEIPSELVVLLLTGSLPSDSALPRQLACPPGVVARWLLPLWNQPAVRQAIRRQKGGHCVQQIDACLGLCVPRRNHAFMPEDTGMYAVSQAALSRDSNILGEAISTTSRRRQSGRDALGSLDESVLSGKGVTNAGVLLLWPLLPQWFSQLGLWRDAAFISDAARWQAVFYLDRLVWGESNPTADRLILNQVLCGVSLLTPEPLAEALGVLQQPLIDDWLTVIGQQLAGWQTLSPTDIRQLFLQRPGELNMEGTFPQVIVHSEPYDFLLKDWPWPMTLASFPWTEQPLTIVWPLTGMTG
ncbi:contractile injection system tape measure protein [Serratia sp. CY76391]|uniref:contractile injection system tape measure protein n=1 Tax=Serratia sp. CY76391 TaxID=3383681 RepID=UPI003FA01CDB